MIGSANHSSAHNGRVRLTAIHSDWRNVRRTSRTALRLEPSADAIIGDDAVITPMQIRASAKVRLRPSAAAASWRGPSQPNSTTSVAWISAIVRLLRISGHASASVAPSSARHGLLNTGAAAGMSFA